MRAILLIIAAYNARSRLRRRPVAWVFRLNITHNASTSSADIVVRHGKALAQRDADRHFASDRASDRNSLCSNDRAAYAIPDFELLELRSTGAPSRTSLHVREIERSSQPLCELLRIVVRPEVHEEQVRRIVDHVTVKRGHFDSMLA